MADKTEAFDKHPGRTFLGSVDTNNIDDSLHGDANEIVDELSRHQKRSMDPVIAEISAVIAARRIWKAPDPDSISNRALKNLPTSVISLFATLVNRIFERSY